MPWWFCPHVHRQSPRKDGFLVERKDKHISFTRTKRGIFHTSTFFFSSRHPFPHSTWRLRLVLVRKWMSRTEKKRLGVKNFPFSSFGRNIYIFSQVPKRAFSRGLWKGNLTKWFFSHAEVVLFARDVWKGIFSHVACEKNDFGPRGGSISGGSEI